MPILTPAPNVATSLAKPVIQSQETVQTEHQLPAQTPIRQQQALQASSNQ